MRRWIPQLIALAHAVSAVAAAPLAADFKIDDKGTFKIGPVQFFLQHFGSEWKGSTQYSLTPAAGYPKRESGSFTLQGNMPGGGASNAFKVNESVVSTGDSSFRYTAALTAEPAIPTLSLALAIDIPTGNPDIGLYVGSEEIALPLTNTDGQVMMHESSADQVVISLPDRQIRIAGSFMVRVQDNRSFRMNTFTVRLLPRFVQSAVSNWKLTADIELLPPATGGMLPGDLKLDAVGNMQIDNIRLTWTQYSRGWHALVLSPGNFKTKEGYPRRTADRLEVAGEWAGFQVQTNVVAAKGGGVSYSSRFATRWRWC